MGQIKQRHNGSGGLIFWMLFLLIAGGSASVAQEPNSAPVFTQAQLEQILAPVALYPDPLLSQILMASTYPLEVVQAQRWVKQNSDLKGDAIAKALEEKSWDPSVKSLTNFPDVLDMMNDKLDWTQQLGDAFLAQQKDVMDTVQALRKKAEDTGNLKTTEQQVVTTQQQVIIIEQANPQVVYVPVYNPTVVYGTWPYPAYPPYYWYPPVYPTPPIYAFGAGLALGAAWGYAWGHCDWRGGDVDVDIDRNANFNRNINRDKYKRTGQLDQSGKGKWQHNPADRRGVPYRDQATAQKYNRASNANAVQSREAYRGRAEQGRQDLSRGGASQLDNRPSAAQRPAAGRDLSSSNVAQRPAGRDLSTSNVSNRGGAFQGMDTGSAARASSNRGQMSRQSMPSGGGMRGGGGGGGMRGGGGGRGGGGRR